MFYLIIKKNENNESKAASQEPGKLRRCYPVWEKYLLPGHIYAFINLYGLHILNPSIRNNLSTSESTRPF